MYKLGTASQCFGVGWLGSNLGGGGGGAGQRLNSPPQCRSTTKSSSRSNQGLTSPSLCFRIAAKSEKIQGLSHGIPATFELVFACQSTTPRVRVAILQFNCTAHTLPGMSKRIFVTCRSNHDPIVVGNLACEALLQRTFIDGIDYIRSAGSFENVHSPTKCQVLVDCAVADRDLISKVPLICYKATSDGDQM